MACIFRVCIDDIRKPPIKGNRQPFIQAPELFNRILGYILMPDEYPLILMLVPVRGNLMVRDLPEEYCLIYQALLDFREALNTGAKLLS